MRKILTSLAVTFGATVFCGALQANFTLFDMAKDAMYITRGEFVGLQRTATGDRLTVRCNEMIKGELALGTEVTLEAFEPAAADAALGREVIVAFNLVNGKHYFLHHPFSQRGAFYFETDDSAPNGLDQSEQSLRNFIAINQPHQEEILGELRKRLQQQDAGYEGVFNAALTNEWKAELLRQVPLSGTWAAFDAAKALVDHDLFKGTLTVADLQVIGNALPASETGSLARAYMLEAIRNEVSAHPSHEVQMQMLRAETSQACVGKLSNLLLQYEVRAQLMTELGQMINDGAATVQQRCNALQTIEALKDAGGLPHVHGAILAEMGRGEDASKPVLRRAFQALRAIPSETSVEPLEAFIASDLCKNSWELTQWAWVAMSKVDSEYTNQQVRDQFSQATNPRNRKFFEALMPGSNGNGKLHRDLLIIHPEE
ncbi:MAG: hypothetical protein IT463_06100 [Planctomycetes bacterium]|nr:hypothetical protein [Planctomycetota bacterium]